MLELSLVILLICYFVISLNFFNSTPQLETCLLTLLSTKTFFLLQLLHRFREFVRTRFSGPHPPRGPTPFPEVRWADKQEIWDLMCKKEGGMYLRKTGEEILDSNPCVLPKMRSILLDWLVCLQKLH